MSVPTTIDRATTSRRIRPAHVIGAALALTALIMVAGMPGPWPKGHAAATTVGVGAGGDAFGPNAVTIAQGDTVTWEWVGGRHSVTSSTSSEPFDSGAQTAGTFQHTFAAAGTFRYLCVWHPGMTGTVVVTPAAAAATAPGAGPGAATTTVTPAAPAAPPKLARVRLTGARLAFSLDNPASVATAAVAGRKTTSVGRVEATSGRSSMPLALDRLRVGRYTLVVIAKNTAGTSARLRVRVRVTGGLRSRAVLTRRAQAARAAKAAAAAATVPVAGAVAPAPTPQATAPAPAAAAPAPAPLVCDKTTTDHSGHGHGSADPRCDHGGDGS